MRGNKFRAKLLDPAAMCEKPRLQPSTEPWKDVPVEPDFPPCAGDMKVPRRNVTGCQDVQSLAKKHNFSEHTGAATGPLTSSEQLLVKEQCALL